MTCLHDYQSTAIDRLRASLLAGKKRPMLQLATGGGKTIISAAVVQLARAKDRRVVFTVPAISLIDQTIERFGTNGITEMGVIQSDHPLTDWTKPVQVASVQTMARRGWPSTDMVIVDEAHQRHQVIERWMAEEPNLPFVGLSATPWTKGLGQVYDDLIIAATTRHLIDRGFLSPFRVFVPSHPDLSGVHTVAGDYHEGELADAMDKPALTADIVATWLKLGENRPTLCFAVNRAHARSLEAQFLKSGITTAYVDAFTERLDRNRIGEAFAAGRVKVVVNVGVLTTGVDWDVRCLILARPTKSEMLFVQIVGRALRTAPGKSDALILDHSDTTLRLGFPDGIHHDHLDNGRPSPPSAQRRHGDAAQPKECGSCHFLKPVGVHQCPECGFAPVKHEDIETRAGELTQIAGGKVAADRQTKQRWWSGLLWYCEQRGYSHGWAGHKFRDKFGVWPRALSERVQAPDAEVRNYVKAGQIRFAKAREKANGQRGAA